MNHHQSALDAVRGEQRLRTLMERYVDGDDVLMPPATSAQIQDLLTAGVSPNISVFDTPLVQHLVIWEQGSLAELALHQGARVNDREFITGRTALHQAVHTRQEPLVAMLLRHGADVHARDGRGHTSLWHAVIKRAAPVDVVDLEVIGTLLLAGASPSEVDMHVARDVQRLSDGLHCARARHPEALVPLLAAAMDGGPASAWAAEHLAQMGHP